MEKIEEPLLFPADTTFSTRPVGIFVQRPCLETSQPSDSEKSVVTSVGPSAPAIPFVLRWVIVVIGQSLTGGDLDLQKVTVHHSGDLRKMGSFEITGTNLMGFWYI